MSVTPVAIAELFERMATRAAHTQSTAEAWREAAWFMRSVDADLLELLEDVGPEDVAVATGFNAEIAAALLEAASTGRLALLDAIDAAPPLYAARAAGVADDDEAADDGDAVRRDLDEEGEHMFSHEA